MVSREVSATQARLWPVDDFVRPFRVFGADIKHVLRPAGRTAHRLLRDRLVVIAVITAFVWVAASVAMYFLEHHEAGTDIHNGWQAAYWTASQMTAVGSAYQNPVSTGASILDIVIKIYAVVVVASLTGAVGAFFVHRKDEEDG